MIALPKDSKLADQQAFAIIFFLAAFAYIDGEFDDFERVFVTGIIEDLVRARAEASGGDEEDARELYLDEYRRTDEYIRELFDESRIRGESLDRYVYARLKLRALEIFAAFDDEAQEELIGAVEGLIAADGVIHPAEAAFRDEVRALLRADAKTEEAIVPAATLRIQPAETPRATAVNHPLLERIELPYVQGTVTSVASRDRMLIEHALAMLARVKEAGWGRLAGKRNLGDLEGSFLDNHVDVVMPVRGRAYEVLVLGDLHGCYSCLKAALLQSGFLDKLQAGKRDPQGSPEAHVVFLGDYLDRGLFGLEGCLRASLFLSNEFPGHVHMLRGNHEYFVEREGHVLPGVMPAESYDRWGDVLGDEHFRAYIRLFEELPTCFVFGRTLMVHGGIPRDDTIDTVFDDLTGLNHPKSRFQMLWSDPSQVANVPGALQKQNARFAFGRAQFRRFMGLIGANVLIRGHEKIRDGFRLVVDEQDVKLVTLFSAGGRTNRDLAPESNYRNVSPKALTLRFSDEDYTATPWTIDFAPYNDPGLNKFVGG